MLPRGLFHWQCAVPGSWQRPSAAGGGRQIALLSRSCFLMAMLACHLSAAGRLGAADESPQTTVIVVVGASGAPQFESLFAEWADRWVAAATKGGRSVVTIGRDESDESITDRQRLQSSLEVAGKNHPSEIWLVLIGHGTFNRRDGFFNLRGPDFSARELANWLKPIDCPMAVINSAAASAPFLSALSHPKRVVIAATKSGSEQNFARFGDFMSRAIDDPSADLDKDDQTSLWEAYLKASRQTAEFYSTDGRLQTEHALLDDNGDGQGVRSDQFRGMVAVEHPTDGKVLDGQAAHLWHLVRSPADSALPPEILKKKELLEYSILQLRNRKESLAEPEYYEQLERMLIELAELNETAGN